MNRQAELMQAMIEHEKEVPERVHHFLKVHAFAMLLAQLEDADTRVQEILDAAAVVHDIGIKPAIVKYQSSAGEYQQMEGPPLAHKLLTQLGYDQKLTERVCYLVAHHHTYTNIDGLDYQLLVEADFLVNILESDMSTPQILSIRTRVFRTKAGIKLLNKLYLGELVV